ncbi:hypothetical protein WJX84_012207 [Apatococcus fuscideae]|uniref:Protein kinase domain-containing protein n=1 Tax=Apatococcus fuscideae TaxID=2026836 RepID=A0AAW1SJ35_9CHLO
MNKYHIYDAIGKGKHSKVFKGREKKTIQYYAIKSVDKSERARVLQEVRTMHVLDHHTILKFHAWYETSNHLWLILEYCVGGDLLSLLRQDVRLPETSIHDIGRDLLVSLQYLHASSVIFCDLKPSNILLDENGRIKLGGFGFSLKLADINKNLLQQTLAKRGSPAYMAPELFQEGCAYSMASDLWSLGCVLYECFAGYPPFVSTSLNQLVHDILNVAPHALEGASIEFQDLVDRLLEKNPALRIAWPDLAEHPFWNFSLPPRSMPEELAFEAFITAHQLRPAAPIPQEGSFDQVRQSGVDVLRLSCIVRSNLEAEAEGAEYNAASTTGAPLNDVQINHQDAELDFDARASDQGGTEEQEASSAAGSAPATTTAGPSSLNLQQQEYVHVNGAPPHASESQAGSQSTPPLQRQSPGSVGLRSSEPEISTPSGPAPADSSAARQGGAGPAENPPIAEPILPASAPRQSSVSMAAAGAPADVVKAPQPDDAQHVAALVWHASDMAVKPIVANRRIERLPEPRWDSRSIPFAILSLQQMLSLGPHELERFCGDIYKVLSSIANPLKDKVNVLAYMETLCIDTGAANQLVSSSLAIHFVRMLRTSRAPALRVRLASVLGLLVRHATVIADALGQSGIIDVLAEGLQDENERVRRRMMATLGELLFYAATQSQDGANQRVWHVADNVFTYIIRLLRPGEDDIAQHYAVKTIENLVSQGNMWARKLATTEVASALLAILGAERKGEAARFTAASTLARLAHQTRDKMEMLNHILAYNGTALIVTGYVRRHASKLSQLPAVFCIGALVVTSNLKEPHRAAAWRPASPEVEKLQKEKEPYIAQAAAFLRAEVASCVPQIVQQLPGHAKAALTGNTAAMQQLQGKAASFSLLLHLITSPAFRPGVICEDLVRCFATCIQLTFVPNSAHLSQFKADLLHALEAITAQADVLMDLREPVLEGLVPALALAIRGEHESGDSRFLCLKLLCDITLPFLAPDGQDAAEDQSGSLAEGGVVDSAVRGNLLPLMPALLDEPEPMPLYAQKLLTHLLDASPAWASELKRLGLVSRFFDFLGLDEANNNVHNIRLCRQTVAAGAAPASVISELQAVDKVGAVLAYAAENSVDTFLEPVLELSLALLDQEAAALENNLPGAGELKALAPALLLLLELCQHQDPPIAEAAAEWKD